MKTFKVLSIDAWADSQNCPYCGSHNVMETTKSNKMKCYSCGEEFPDNEGITWTWNNWFDSGKFQEEKDGELNEENALKFFFGEYPLQYEGLESFKSAFDIEDDQYNLVLYRKSDYRPMYAIEYGSQY